MEGYQEVAASMIDRRRERHAQQANEIEVHALTVVHMFAASNWEFGIKGVEH